MATEAIDAASTDFLVRKDSINEQRFRHRSSAPAPQSGELLMHVDQFALTANNITYAAFGEAMNYWRFFPTDEEDWGRVPVWGFANVVQSRCTELPVGERIYGFLPMSTHLLIRPKSISASGFIDQSDHRRDLHLIYNQYSRVLGDPAYQQEYEAQQMIFRPLFTTSFLIEDLLRGNRFFDSDRLIVSSASSKTAIGVAYQVTRADQRPGELVGLTAESNMAFVEALGLYDLVVSYEDIEELDPITPTVFIDIAGNSQVRKRIHELLTSQLHYSCAVGASHWDANLPHAPMPGPAPELFFAPSYFLRRVEELGTDVLMAQFAKAWSGFVRSTDAWLEIVYRNGESAIKQSFNEMLSGTVVPSKAFVLSF